MTSLSQFPTKAAGLPTFEAQDIFNQISAVSDGFQRDISSDPNPSLAGSLTQG